jgi:hypothetical protein
VKQPFFTVRFTGFERTGYVLQTLSWAKPAVADGWKEQTCRSLIPDKCQNKLWWLQVLVVPQEQTS